MNVIQERLKCCRPPLLRLPDVLGGIVDSRYTFIRAHAVSPQLYQHVKGASLLIQYARLRVLIFPKLIPGDQTTGHEPFLQCNDERPRGVDDAEYLPQHAQQIPTGLHC